MQRGHCRRQRAAVVANSFRHFSTFHWEFTHTQTHTPRERERPTHTAVSRLRNAFRRLLRPVFRRCKVASWEQHQLWLELLAETEKAKLQLKQSWLEPGAAQVSTSILRLTSDKRDEPNPDLVGSVAYIPVYTYICLSVSWSASIMIPYISAANRSYLVQLTNLKPGAVAAAFGSLLAWSTDSVDVVFRVTALKLPTNTARRTDWGLGIGDGFQLTGNTHTHIRSHTHTCTGGKIHFIAGIW